MAWLRAGMVTVGLLALIGCGACGDDDAPPPGDGGTPPRDAGDGGGPRGMDGGDGSVGTDGPSVELGTGSRDFTPVNDGDTLLLARGCQGGQHVWTGLRIRELDPRSAIVQLQMLRTPDGEAIECSRDAGPTVCRPLETCNGFCQNAYPYQVRTTFEEAPTGEYATIVGLVLQTPDPEGLLETDVLIRARVVERGTMRMVETMRTVRIEWGTETCTSRDGAPPLGDGGLIPMDPPDAG